VLAEATVSISGHHIPPPSAISIETRFNVKKATTIISNLLVCAAEDIRLLSFHSDE
jgi:hypothetical protein